MPNNESAAEPRVWGLIHWVIGGMGALIIFLLGLNIAMMRENDQATIRQLTELRAELVEYNKVVVDITKRVTVLEVQQKTRLDREKMEDEFRMRFGVPKKLDGLKDDPKNDSKQPRR